LGEKILNGEQEKGGKWKQKKENRAKCNEKYKF
jgi:hypothetical protein